jgi:hypothetical protein
MTPASLGRWISFTQTPLEVPAVDASQVGRSFNISDGEEDEAGVADGDIARPMALLEAGTRLADGAAAGLAAVAAAGAGEVASAAAAGSKA